MSESLTQARPVRSAAAWTPGLALIAAVLCGPSRADETRTVPLLPAYVQECGACHVAYAPRLLPAASWQRLMSRLQTHYGSDATLDPALTQTLSTWLQANAATGRRAREQPPEDRITRSAWFAREHAELPAATFTQPAVKSPARCDACHTRANEGDFSERYIQLPR